MIQPFLLKKELCFKEALDFSFLLDAPAGKYGFTAVKDGHFQVGGKRIRFYGFNIPFASLYLPKQESELLAERLSKAGVNFARIHAEDAIPWSPEDGNNLIDYTRGNSRSFDPEKLDRLDYLFHCLKQKGIYMQLDLFCYRGFLPDDGLDYPDGLMKYFKQVNVFNRRLIELQKEFAAEYLGHRNPYTGLRYADDPAVAVVQIMNEDGIFWYEGRDQIGLPSYRAELTKRFNQYLLAKYGSRKALDIAWTKEDGTRCLLEDEDPEQGTVRRLVHLEGTQMYVDWKADYRGMASPVRYADYTEFLARIQLDFSYEMRNHVLSLGVKCPINISNHAQGAADIYSLDRYADVNQDNAYWNHPETVDHEKAVFHSMNMVENDPRKTVVDSPFKLNLVTRLNHDRVSGKPFMAAEWNILYGSDFRSDALPMVAAYACLQDWDGLVLYAYHHSNSMEQYDDSMLDRPFNLFNDPATWGQVALCSYLFQKGLVSQGRNLLEVCYSERDLYAVPRNWIAPYGYASYVSRVAARFIGLKYEGDADVALASGNTPTGDYTEAKHGLIFSRSHYVDGAQKYKGLDAFLKRHAEAGGKFAVVPAGDEVDEDYRNYSHLLDKAMKRWGLLSGDQGLVEDGRLVSDTDELDFDFRNGIFRIDTPQVKTASGNIKGRVELGRYHFDVKNERMTLSLLSLDGRDTDQSEHLLLVALGWCGNLEMKFETGEGDKRILRDVGHGPVSIDSLEGSLTLAEPVTENGSDGGGAETGAGADTVAGKDAGFAVYPLNPDGSRMKPLEGKYKTNFIGEGTMYFEICRK
jgi:hypothetical protein